MVRTREENRADRAHPRFEDFADTETAWNAINKEADRLSESARVIEGRWKARNKVIVGFLMLVSAFLGFLFADWAQLRLFSSPPLAEIDGKPPTADEIEVIRGFRATRETLDRRRANELKENRTANAERAADLVEATKLAKDLVGDDPEQKKKLREMLEKMIPEAKVKPPYSLRTANRQNSEPLMVGQNDESSGSNSGADIR